MRQRREPVARRLRQDEQRAAGQQQRQPARPADTRQVAHAVAEQHRQQNDPRDHEPQQRDIGSVHTGQDGGAGFREGHRRADGQHHAAEQAKRLGHQVNAKKPRFGRLRAYGNRYDGISGQSGLLQARHLGLFGQARETRGRVVCVTNIPSAACARV
jgi:hypothetical protein